MKENNLLYFPLRAPKPIPQGYINSYKNKQVMTLVGKKIRKIYSLNGQVVSEYQGNLNKIFPLSCMLNKISMVVSILDF
jgi:hypothetical protein